jgi:bisphosphoglycerate-dependent phosphoglycerate mutase
MGNKELLQELKENFEKMKQELGFKSSLKDIDRIFFIKDFILKERFVSPSLSRQLGSRIANLYSNWAGYIHSLVMPNPQNMLNLSESKLFSQEEKQELSKLMSKAMEMSSRNGLIGLTKDKTEEAKFIDEAVELWNNSFEQEITKIMKKINSAWKGEEK